MSKYYIQLGAAQGNDFFYRKYVLGNPDGKFIFVEPISYEKLEDFYKDKNINYEIIKKAVVPNHMKQKTATMFKYDEQENSDDFSSLMLRQDKKPSSEIKVELITIHDLLSIIPKEDTIQLLFIDIEGADREVIISIDLDRFPIKELIFETGQELMLDKKGEFCMKSLEFLLYRILYFRGYIKQRDGYPEWKSSPNSNEYWKLPEDIE